MDEIMKTIGMVCQMLAQMFQPSGNSQGGDTGKAQDMSMAGGTPVSATQAGGQE
jgi:hypothetical protein